MFFDINSVCVLAVRLVLVFVLVLGSVLLVLLGLLA